MKGKPINLFTGKTVEDGAAARARGTAVSDTQKARVLQVLFEAYPDAISHAEICIKIGSNRASHRIKELIDEGWLPEDAGLWGGGGHRADFDGLRTHQGYWMPQAWRRFDQGATPAQRADFEAFCDAEAHWLDDYALFAALLDAHQGQAWWDWPEALAQRLSLIHI